MLKPNALQICRTAEYFPDLMVNRAIEFIEVKKNVPFFMTACFNLPHYPEQAGEKFQNAYPNLPMPRQSYARVISTVDEHIGRIIDKLEAIGLRDRMIIILMSDNGHSTGDGTGITTNDHASGYPPGHYYHAHGGGGNTGPWIGHKNTFLEGGIRVPAIIGYPAKLPKAQTRDQIVTIMDWFPTLLQLCGIQQQADAPKLDGHSLANVIADPKASSGHKILHFAWAKNWAIRKNNWKLIGKFDAETGTTNQSLHNLSDPEPEVKDHAQEQPQIFKDLYTLHQAWDKDLQLK